MKLTLIGMSEIGKTMWSRELEKHGYLRYTIDDMIEEKLEKELVKQGFHGGIAEVAKWLGHPYAPQYPKNSQRYLALEEESTQVVLEALQKASDEENIVADTTGSIIYLGQDLLDQLAKVSTIVYLDAPQSVQDQMYDMFCAEPKPLIWADQFRKKQDQSHNKALAECYPRLLQSRSKEYAKYAHVTLDYFELRKDTFTVEDFLKLVDINT